MLGLALLAVLVVALGTGSVQRTAPDVTPDREVSAGGDFAAGNGPVHYGSVVLPLQADEDVVLDNSGLSNHTITLTRRSNAATSSRNLPAGASLPLRGRGVQAIQIDTADSAVYWDKGKAGSVFPTNPNLGAGGAATVGTTSLNGGNSWTPTSTATFLMLGAGGTLAMTPKRTGTVEITLQGIFVSGGAASHGNVKGNYGTGSAPAQNAAVAGTTIGGNNVQLAGPSVSGITGVNMPFTLVLVVSGLTVGTAYWFDLAAAISNAADAYSNLAGSVKELWS
jgi:hypothetical protein